MAATQINPTRMELTRLKKKLGTAVKGHRLLKDKRDELMREFLDLVKVNMELREKVEQGIKNANNNFVLAKAGMSDEELRDYIIDELHRKGGAVFLGDSVRDIGVQLGAVELAVSYLRHDFVTEKFRCRILDLLHEIAGQGQGENEGQEKEASHRLV